MFSKNYTKVIFTSIASLTFVVMSSVAVSAKQNLEKCTGIVKDGKADGQSIIDGKKVDWILVPAGACIKLVDGKVIYVK